MGNAKRYFEEIKNAYTKMQEDDILNESIESACLLMTERLKAGNMIYIFGNGGSAADSQHLAAELMGQFEKKRIPLPAIALTTDTSFITAYSNDYGPEYIFARQIQGLGKPGDIAIGFTTSDASACNPHSKNIYLGFVKAKQKQMFTIGFVSEKTKHLLSLLDVAIRIPHSNTAIIQGCHEAIFHYICKVMDEHFSCLCP